MSLGTWQAGQFGESTMKILQKYFFVKGRPRWSVTSSCLESFEAARNVKGPTKHSVVCFKWVLAVAAPHYGDLERGGVIIGAQERVPKQDTQLRWRCYQGSSMNGS